MLHAACVRPIYRIVSCARRSATDMRNAAWVDGLYCAVLIAGVLAVFLLRVLRPRFPSRSSSACPCIRGSPSALSGSGLHRHCRCCLSSPGRTIRMHADSCHHHPTPRIHDDTGAELSPARPAAKVDCLVFSELAFSKSCSVEELRARHFLALCVPFERGRISSIHPHRAVHLPRQLFLVQTVSGEESQVWLAHRMVFASARRTRFARREAPVSEPVGLVRAYEAPRLNQQAVKRKYACARARRGRGSLFSPPFCLKIHCGGGYQGSSAGIWEPSLACRCIVLNGTSMPRSVDGVRIALF